MERETPKIQIESKRDIDYVKHNVTTSWIRNIFSNAAPNIQINGSDFDPENQEYSDTESFNDNLFQNVQSFQAQVENKILNIVERRKNIPGNSDNLVKQILKIQSNPIDAIDFNINNNTNNIHNQLQSTIHPTYNKGLEIMSSLKKSVPKNLAKLVHAEDKMFLE
ncbi:23313_t:CDS:2 [Entrophospora sp. SA101]|nr:23313_t:CDS:2 [Entrophospora sp. SA101]